MSDPQTFPELTRRQEDILVYIVQSYTSSPEPVSSRFIAENAGLGVSSATVRNEMARLEEMDYITAPHTSAGRIPTALGYRYVVRDLMRDNELSLNDRQYIDHKFDDLPNVLEQWMRRAATVLARTAQTASLVTPPVAENSHFKHMQLISIQGRLALMVLVLQGGVVHQRMLNLAQPVQQTTLTETANHINSFCDGLTGTQIRMKSRQFDELAREAAELAGVVRAELVDRAVFDEAQVVDAEHLATDVNLLVGCLAHQLAGGIDIDVAVHDPVHAIDVHLHQRLAVAHAVAAGLHHRDLGGDPADRGVLGCADTTALLCVGYG